MATQNKLIQTTELDFDGLKESLKTFMQGLLDSEGNPIYTDYVFEGSGLSALLDVLAYNTHYNALYTNLAINEAFIDSAAKRASVVSKAKELGYIPYSSKCAIAKVNLTMINQQLSAPDTIEVQKNTPFSTTVDGKQYVFYTTQSYIGYKNGNQYSIPNVDLREGTPLEYRYVVGQTSNSVIPNSKVDLTTLEVIVQENSTSATIETFVNNESVLTAGPTSKVYFIKENDTGLYEVEFGNGIIGRALSPGNVVIFKYFVSSEDAANGARTFLYAGPSIANTQVFVTTVDSAVGGTGPEAIESIRWRAPRAYAAQNRCVSSQDYKTIITSLFPGIRAINVWGGDEAVPPQYGKVFIAIVPESSDFLSDDDKEYIINYILKPRKSLAIVPEIVDPIFIDIQLDTSFYYDQALTSKSAGELKSLVQSTIADYDETYLASFGSVFKFSQLSRLIDQTETSILSNITRVLIHREIEVSYNVANRYYINLGNPIYNSGVAEESILSSGFYPIDSTYICYIDDQPRVDGVYGDLRMFYINTAGKKVTVRNVGVVDYSAGIIDITELTIVNLYDPVFKLIIKPQSNDVVPVERQFVRILPSLTTITPVIESQNTAYKFTSSRN